MQTASITLPREIPTQRQTPRATRRSQSKIKSSFIKTLKKQTFFSLAIIAVLLLGIRFGGEYSTPIRDSVANNVRYNVKYEAFLDRVVAVAQNLFMKNADENAENQLITENAIIDAEQ